MIRGHLYDDIVSRVLYSTDASMFQVLPKLVIEPKSIDDVIAALKKGMPVTPRGAGTGLAGESLGEGVIVDFSVYMNKILSFDNETVTVQPGISLGELNKFLKQHGKIFGPDPATENRCTIGGMIANNSTGARSLVYGMTRDNLVSLKILDAKGRLHDLSEMSTDRSPFKDVVNLLEQNDDLIKRKTPKTPRNRHGYLLDGVVKDKTVNLARLICASEGTLGIIVEATLKVNIIPKFSRLLCLKFDKREKAAAAAYPLLKYKPTAVEIIDSICLEMARSRKVYSDFFDKSVNSLLLVELVSDYGFHEIDEKVKKIEEEFVGKFSTGLIYCKNEEVRLSIWTMRKLIAGMIGKMPGKYKPIPLIEDVCILPQKLPEYFSGVDLILTKNGLKWLAFGHAGAGTVHIRPLIDMKKNVRHVLPDICKEVYELTLSLGGTISGEHGDGYLRAPFMEMQYGDLFHVMKEIKKLFDPDNILNPDKKTGCKDFSKWKSLRVKKNIKYDPILKFKNFSELVELCNGCGECLVKHRENDMCPMHRVIGREVSSTRAKANVVRALLYGDLSLKEIKQIKKVADYCINCKMCEVDCPSNVPAGDLMIEIKALAGQKIDEKPVLYLEKMLVLLSNIPKFANFFSNTFFSKMFLRSLKLSTERDLPRLADKSFIKSVAVKKHSENDLKVVYFVDTFSNFINTNVAVSTVALLEHIGARVIVPPQVSSGVVHMNYGDLSETKKLALKNYNFLMPYVNDGYLIVFTEPSAELMFRREYLLLDECFSQLSCASIGIMEFLAKLKDENKLKEFSERNITIGYHKPCHSKVLKSSGAVKVLKSVPGINVRVLDKGCCGIAGTYGFRQKGYENSMKIGNELFKALSDEDINIGVTECSTCRLQMEHGVKNKRTLHPVEVLADAYSL